jgi:hypothetical protein
MMVSPTSQRRLVWELCVITPLVIFLVAALPFTICFKNEARGGMAVFNIIIDLVFLTDMLLIFRTGIIVDVLTREQDYDPWHIADRYVRGWFCVDFLSSIPFGILDLEVFDSIRSAARKGHLCDSDDENAALLETCEARQRR